MHRCTAMSHDNASTRLSRQRVVRLDHLVAHEGLEALDRLGLGPLAHALAELLPPLVNGAQPRAQQLGRVGVGGQVHVEDFTSGNKGARGGSRRAAAAARVGNVQQLQAAAARARGTTA